MRFKPWRALARTALVPALAASISGQAVLADAPQSGSGCIAVTGIHAEIEKFLGEVSAAQAAGQGTLPLRDVLFGITGISAADETALGQRDPVEVARRDDAGGAYSSRGPKRITVEGMFAARDTYFRIPKLVLGKYTLTESGVTLVYDPAHTVQVGESVLGMKFFKSMNHTVITRTRLAFFFDSNTGADPDRCYRVAQD